MPLPDRFPFSHQQQPRLTGGFGIQSFERQDGRHRIPRVDPGRGPNEARQKTEEEIRAVLLIAEQGRPQPGRPVDFSDQHIEGGPAFEAAEKLGEPLLIAQPGEVPAMERLARLLGYQLVARPCFSNQEQKDSCKPNYAIYLISGDLSELRNRVLLRTGEWVWGAGDITPGAGRAGTEAPVMTVEKKEVEALRKLAEALGYTFRTENSTTEGERMQKVYLRDRKEDHDFQGYAQDTEHPKGTFWYWQD